MSHPILFGGVLMENTENPYLDPPTIPVGQTCNEYRLSKMRRRSWLRRVWRRLHGH
jgi:hypothetical protein